MRSISIPILILAAGLSASGAQAQVRPGWEGFAARFDAGAPIVLTGDVTAVDWAHGVGPKVFVTLAAPDEGGAVASWTVEGPFTDIMRATGFDTENLRPGARISVRGYRAKDGSRDVYLRAATLADGRKLTIRSSSSAQ